MNAGPGKKAVLLVLILAVGVFYAATLRNGHNPGGDFAQYILHARNLAEGRPYADTGYIYNPHFAALGPRSYPPVLPLMLAPLYKCFGLDLFPMKILLVVFFMLFLAACAALAMRSLPFPYTAALLLVTGLSPFFWNFKDSIVSDIPFLFLVFLFLWFTDRKSGVKTESSGVPWGGGLVCGVMMALALGIRTIGIALPLVLVVDGFYRRRKIDSFTAVSCAVFLALALVQNAAFPGGGSYLDQFRGLTPGVVLKNAMLYADAMIRFWDNGSAAWGFLRVPLFLALMLFACAGFWAGMKKPGPAEWFVLVYLPMVLLWPTPQGARFLIPVFPLFLFWAFKGLERVRKLRFRKTAFWILMAAVAFTYAAKYGTLNFGPIPGGMNDQKRMDCVSFIRSHTLQTDVFICDEPRFLALMAGRRATSFFIPRSDAAFWNYASGVHAAYLVVGPGEPGSIREIVERHMESLNPVYDKGGFIIYQIR